MQAVRLAVSIKLPLVALLAGASETKALPVGAEVQRGRGGGPAHPGQALVGHLHLGGSQSGKG